MNGSNVRRPRACLATAFQPSLSAFLAVSLTLAAPLSCGGKGAGGATAGSGGGSDGGTGGGNTGVRKPVTPVPDDAKHASADLDRAGGSIVATGADGTRYTLAVPANALTGKQTITVTPLVRIDALPLTGGLVGGVQLGPEGLVLYSSATLTVEPPGSPDRARLLGVGYAGNGEDFHLTPLSSDGKLALRVSHFSGSGVAQGSISDLAGSQPASAEARAQETIAGIVHDASARVPPKLTPDESKAIQSALREWYAGSVLPVLQGAIDDDTKLDGAIFAFVSWQSSANAQLLGDSVLPLVSDLQDAGLALLGVAFTNAVDKAYRRCANHDLEQVRELLRRRSQADLLQLGNHGFDLEQPLRDVRKCGRFQLEFISGISFLSARANGGTTVEATVSFGEPTVVQVETSVRLVTEVVVTLETLSGQFTAPAPSECSPWAGTFEPASFVAKLIIYLDSSPDLFVDPGSPIDRWTTTCRGIPASFEGVWRDAWMALHSSALTKTAGGDFFVFGEGDGWQVTASSSVYATLMYDQMHSLRDGVVHEATMMTLRHVPQ